MRPKVVDHPIPGPDAYATVKELSRLFPTFSERSIRYLISNSHANGFDKCLRRIGRKIIINVEDFERWIEDRRQV